MKKININSIRIDGGTQSRVSLNEATVAEYIESLDALPPVVVFFDGSEHWLADGFHRLHAYRQAGKASIPADVREGTCREAILHSLGANASHGLRRSNADKRKAVQTVLDDTEWAQWSDRKIAEICGVGAPFVGDVRRSICNPITDAPTVRTVERAGKIYRQDTGRIGKTSEKPEKRELPKPVEPEADDQLSEAHHTITELAQENDELRDRLAVESLMDSEEAKTQTSETIRHLRTLVKTLEAEVEALKVSRDTYMREANEAKKSVIYWRKQAEKAAKDAA